MSPLMIVLPLAVLLITALVFIIIFATKQAERKKYYIAAGNTLKEEYLDYSLRNNLLAEGSFVPEGIKLMVYIKTKCNKKKIQYVFNPEKRILIGRDKHESNIYVSDNRVSKKHCCIYSHNGHVFLEDLNAANGTIVKRGLFSRYGVYSNNRIVLNSGDKIVIGGNVFKVILFYYDMSTM